MESKKKIRASDTLDLLTKGGDATFFTLTTPDVVDYSEIAARWRLFRHDFVQDIKRRKGVAPLYVMNFEKHPGFLQKVVNKDTFDEWILHSDGNSHGWHIHGVVNQFFPLVLYRPLLYQCGFGRVDVRKVTSKGVSDYLTKHALKAYRGISKRERARSGTERLRLVNVSRGLPSLRDYVYNSDYLEKVRKVNQAKVDEVHKAGDKIANALAVWKLSELQVQLSGTPFVSSSHWREYVQREIKKNSVDKYPLARFGKILYNINRKAKEG